MAKKTGEIVATGTTGTTGTTAAAVDYRADSRFAALAQAFYGILLAVYAAKGWNFLYERDVIGPVLEAPTDSQLVMWSASAIRERHPAYNKRETFFDKGGKTVAARAGNAIKAQAKHLAEIALEMEALPCSRNAKSGKVQTDPAQTAAHAAALEASFGPLTF